MGKLQGPRGLLGTPACSAGFMSVSGNAYYKWIFDAAAGEELAFGFAPGGSAGSGAVAALWRGVGEERGLLTRNENRFLSWMWTQMTEASADDVAARAVRLGVQTIVLLST